MSAFHRHNKLAQASDPYGAPQAEILRREISASASDQLRDRTLDMFARFEARHGLPQGLGERFQMRGYRA